MALLAELRRASGRAAGGRRANIVDQRTRAPYRRLGGPPGLVALAVAAWLAAAAFLAHGGPAARAESQPVFRDQHFEFTVERNGQAYTVRIEQLIVDDGSGGFDAVAASAKSEALSRFAGATEAVPGEVTAQFTRASYSWPANTAAWRYNSAHKLSSLTDDASVLGAAAATWGKAGANFSYTGGAATTDGTGACHDVPDGSNTVGWASQTGTTLASTCTWYDNRGGAIEFDMEIDPEWGWTTSTTNIGVDLQSVTLHEFGLRSV